MTNRPHIFDCVWLVALAFVGCGVSSPANESESQPANAEAPAYPAASPSARDDGQRDAESPRDLRLSVGPISFALPDEWEAKKSQTAEGITMFAPERPEWKEIGFRANLGVRSREQSGLTFEELQTAIETTLAQSVEQANATVVAHAREASQGKLADLSLQLKRAYRLTPTKIDGVQTLSTEFSGLYELNGKLVATQTYGLQILGPKQLYSVSLTFPQQFADEMEPVWRTFVDEVKIDDASFQSP